MVPGRSGFDAPEDPDIGIFGGAYLTRAYINRIGLKRYDFTVTDAPGRGVIAINDLKKIYGDEVFNKVKEMVITSTREHQLTYPKFGMI